MSTRAYDPNGTLVQFWDDGPPRVYTEWNADGVQILQRPYNDEENARADADAIATQQDSNRRSIEQALFDALATLQGILDDTNANINLNPATRIKDLARAQRRVIRLLIRRFDDAS